MEASNLVPDFLLRMLRADRESQKPARPLSTPQPKSPPATARQAAPRRRALVMALSSPRQSKTLIAWLGKG